MDDRIPDVPAAEPPLEPDGDESAAEEIVATLPPIDALNGSGSE